MKEKYLAAAALVICVVGWTGASRGRASDDSKPRQPTHAEAICKAYDKLESKLDSLRLSLTWIPDPDQPAHNRPAILLVTQVEKEMEQKPAPQVISNKQAKAVMERLWEAEFFYFAILRAKTVDQPQVKPCYRMLITANGGPSFCFDRRPDPTLWFLLRSLRKELDGKAAEQLDEVLKSFDPLREEWKTAPAEGLKSREQIFEKVTKKKKATRVHKMIFYKKVSMTVMVDGQNPQDEYRPEQRAYDNVWVVYLRNLPDDARPGGWVLIDAISGNEIQDFHWIVGDSIKVPK